MIPGSDQGGSEAGGYRQRLLAEALRRHEETSDPLPGDAHAELAAISSGADFETRICRRADVLAERLGLQHTLSRFERGIRLAFLIIVIAGALLGIGATRAVLNPDSGGLVNFYWVLVALLGVHTVAMLLWIVLLLTRRHLPPASPLLAPFLGLARMLTASGQDPGVTAALGTWTGIISSGALGRWGLSMLLHSFWLAALAGTLGTVLLLLSARQFDFVWETTILPARTFIATTEKLGELPRALGLQTPDRETILASRRDNERKPPAEARRAWSSLLIGSLLAYGILPRAGLLLLSALLYRRARRRYRLDLELPGYARLHGRLMPTSRRMGVIDAGDGRGGAEQQTVAGRLPLAWETAVLGIEIDVPGTGWPPRIARQLRDLGIAADRDTCTRALHAIAALQHAPLALLVVASLITSPDRGIARRLRELRSAHHGPLGLLLTQQGKAQQRLEPDAYQGRLTDWRQIAVNAGIDPVYIAILDLDDAEAVRAWHFARENAESEPPPA